MSDNKNGNSANINDILDMLSKEYGTQTQTVRAEEGVVFDSSRKTSSYTADAPSSTVKAAQTSAPKTTGAEQNRVNVGGAYDSSRTEEVPRLHSTYVPRFTEVSQNYRMADDPRPATRARDLVSQTMSSYDASVGGVKIDPTAEIDAGLDNSSAIAVNIKPYKEETPDTAKVFKFKTPVAETADAPAEPAEWSEETGAVYSSNAAEGISGYAPRVESVVEEPAEAASYEAAEASEDSLESFSVYPEPKEYSIPDPVQGGTTSVSGYASVRRTAQRNDEVPENVGDKIDSTKKRVASEYTAYAQRDSFKDMFLDSILSVKLRFFAAIALALVLLVFENLSLFGVDVPRLLGIATIPGAMALIDLQFIFCFYLLAIPEVISSFKCLASGKIVPEFTFTMTFVVSVIYSLVMMYNSPAEYPLFGLLFAVSSIIVIISSYYKKCADFTSFKVISLNGEKRIVDRKFTRILERENVALDGLVEEHKSKTARMFRTTFISDFFKRSEYVDENTGNVLLTLVIALGISFVCGTVAFFIPGGMVNAAIAFTVVFMFACPAFSALVHKLPYFHAMTESITEKSAFIGETSFYGYAEVDVVTFNDTEVFGPEDVNLQRVMLYGNSENLGKALRHMSALFMNAGGPLDYLFSNSLDRKCPAANDPRIDIDGVSGEIDGHIVFAGTLEYMHRNGIKVPEEASKSNPSSADSTRVMYAAEDGVVYAKFYIRYSFSEEFTMILPILQEQGIIPLIYTRDPNITSSLIDALTAGGDRIRILKKQNSPINDDPVFGRLSAGLVTLGDKMNAINTILLAKKYVRLQSGFNMLESISLIFGSLLSAIIAIAGVASSVPSVLFAVWPLIWTVIIGAISKKIFHITSKKK